jgi:hypothetical protein
MYILTVKGDWSTMGTVSLKSINDPRHDKTNSNGFATSMDPDQPAHPRSLIRIHAVRLSTLLQVEKLTANSNRS